MPRYQFYELFSKVGIVFESCNFDLKDMKLLGRSTDFDEDQLNKLIKKDAPLSTEELGEQMNCSHMAVYLYQILSG